MVPQEIHRREIEVRVGPARSGLREVASRVRDFRLQGFTWVGAHVVAPGPVHDMSADFQVDVEAGRIQRAKGEMALAAFDGTPDTRFQGCRDILPNLADLSGLALDEGLVGGIRQAIGRERGCYHLTTLVLTTAPVLRALSLLSLAPEDSWRRALSLSGSALGSGRYRFEGEIRDERPQAGSASTHLAFEVDTLGMRLGEVLVERGSGRVRDPEAEALLGGMSLAAGFAPQLVARVGAPELEPVRELALGLSSIVTQVLIAEGVPDAVPTTPKPSRAANTCWMWRQGGPLEAMEVGIGDEPPS